MPRRRPAPPRPAIAHARVSADELADWQAKAAAAGVSLSELLRQAMARDAALDGAGTGGRARAHAANRALRLELEPESPAGRTPM